MKLFLSHASADLHWAEWIGVLLQGAGHEVFLRHWEVGAGESIPAWIERRIAEADKVIAVFTPAYLAAQGPRADAAPPGRGGGTQTRTEGAERLAAVWRDLSGRDGFLVPIEVEPVATWPTLSSGRHALSLVDLDEGTAESTLIRFLEPPSRPTGKVAFPGKAKAGGGKAGGGKAGGGEETVTVTVETTAPAKPKVEPPPPVAPPQQPPPAPASRKPRQPAPHPSQPPRVSRTAPDDPRPIIRSREDLENWLEGKPTAFAKVIAVRAALRVAPLLVRLRSHDAVERAPSALLQSLLRGMAAPWAAAKYPTHGTAFGLRATSLAATAAFAYAATYDAVYAIARAPAHDAARAAVAAARAAYASADATSSSAASASADAASSAAYAADDNVAACWDAVVLDVQALHDRADPTNVVTRLLWPNGIPDEIAHAMNELWSTLGNRQAENWHHWLEWLNDRLSDDPTRTAGDEEKDLARLTLPEEMWEAATKSVEGVKAVNAEIARRLKAIDDRRAREAAELRDEEEPEGEPGEGDDRVAPPSEPIRPPAPAARFCVRGQVVDVLPFVPSAGDLPQEAHDYHADAAAIAAKLAERFAGGNAPDRLMASITAANQVLGGSIAEIQPDRLRRLSRKLSADAQTYSHPQAEWEVVPDAVSELLELSGLVEDLQHWFPTSISANAAAIRDLALTPASAATLREVNDRIEEVVEVAEGVVSERVVDTFVADRILSGETTAPVDVESEGERALVTANLINTLARSLNRDEPAAGVLSGERTAPPAPPPEADAGGAGSGEPPKKKTRPQRKKSPSEVRRPETWADVVEETVRQIKEKAPAKVADAVIEAVTKTIKTAPVSLPALAATLWATALGNPVLMAVPGVALSLAWIGYALWKRYKSLPPPP